MPYSTELEEKIDTVTKRWKDLGKKKMFGGVGYLLRGNMCFGIWKDFLIVRMEKDRAGASLRQKNVRPFDITGTVMAGWVMVAEAGWRRAAGLSKWLETGKEFAASLPEKTGKAARKETKTLRDYRG